MPANDEFPRGYTLTARTSSATAQIIVPAVPNVAHVCDFVVARCIETAGAAFPVFRTLQILDGANVIMQQIMVVTVGATPDEFSIGGLGLVCTIGNQMIVQFDGSDANSVQNLIGQFHDI